MLSLIVAMTLGVCLISSLARRTAAMKDAAISKALLDFSSPTIVSVGEYMAKVNPPVQLGSNWTDDDVRSCADFTRGVLAVNFNERFIQLLTTSYSFGTSRTARH